MIKWKNIPQITVDEVGTVKDQFNELKRKFPRLTVYRLAKLLNRRQDVVQNWIDKNLHPVDFYFRCKGLSKHINLTNNTNNKFEI
jgi:hypothetical protein